MGDGSVSTSRRRLATAETTHRLHPSRRDAIRRRLLAWYATTRRDLPWRRTDDPYRIWLSETMLQQTRVETVVPYYERFLDRFPTVESLATADEEDVLREWAGLGYYARARNLKRAAEAIVRDHGGQVPADPDALSSLPGVGRYTTGAIRSIAFGEAAPIVDGNVTRVLARIEALERPSPSDLWSLSEALVPADEPGEFNQGLMELGATVCTPRTPTCPRCPVRKLCRAASLGSPETFPAPRPRTAPREVRATAALVRLEALDAVLVARRPSRGLLGGLWELPSVEGNNVGKLRNHLRERYGLRVRGGTRMGKVEHLFSHRALTLEIVAFRATGRGQIERDTGRFCTPTELAALPLSALMRKSLSLGGISVRERS